MSDSWGSVKTSQIANPSHLIPEIGNLPRVDFLLLHRDSFPAIALSLKTQYFSVPSSLSADDSLFYHDNRSNQKVMPSSSPTQFTNIAAAASV